MVSAVFGVSSRAIIDQLLLQPDGDFDVAPFVNHRCKVSHEEIQAAVDGFLCHEQAEKLKIILSHMDSLKDCKPDLDSLILSSANKVTMANTVVSIEQAIAFVKRSGFRVIDSDGVLVS